MFERYDIVSDGDLRAAVARLDQTAEGMAQASALRGMKAEKR